MKQKVLALSLGIAFLLSTVGAAFAAHEPGHKVPKPPKCTPASTPGCS